MPLTRHLGGFLFRWQPPGRALVLRRLQDYARGSPYGAPVAPPLFVIGCFSGIQFGWPGLGSFHSQSHLTFERPVYWGDVVEASCVYEGFDGPSPSSFAGRTVTDRFANTYTNQRGERIATVSWQVINFERGRAAARQGSGTGGAVLPHAWTEDEVAEIEARVLAERPRGAGLATGRMCTPARSWTC